MQKDTLRTTKVYSSRAPRKNQSYSKHTRRANACYGSTCLQQNGSFAIASSFNNEAHCLSPPMEQRRSCVPLDLIEGLSSARVSAGQRKSIVVNENNF